MGKPYRTRHQHHHRKHRLQHLSGRSIRACATNAHTAALAAKPEGQGDGGGACGAFQIGSFGRRVCAGSAASIRKKQAGGQLCREPQRIVDRFLIQPDGFSRFVIRDVGLRALQAGRLVQRVLEIETYRMMALLSLPYAQRAVPVLNASENELAALTAAMVETAEAAANRKERTASDDDQALLDQITRLAARIEKLTLDNSYRFSASQAYFRLIHARIEELRETRMEGFQMVEEFMDRRLTPAMNTCQAISSRQDALGRRFANTNDLLRSRGGIMQERQNRQILQSMNTRAAQQLRLQQAVEGLSVAAITYYVIGLFSYAGKAAKSFGLLGNPDAATGILVPVVAAAVWLGLRRMHKRMHASPRKDKLPLAK